MLDAAGVEWVDVDDLPRLKQSYGKFRTPCDQTLTFACRSSHSQPSQGYDEGLLTMD